MKQPTDINAARRLAYIAERAANMFTTGGYLAYRYGPDRWSVQNPAGTRYAVKLSDPPSCDCPDFQKHRDACKHIVGLQAQLDREEEGELCAQYEARYGACELETTGCDPYAEY